MNFVSSSKHPENARLFCFERPLANPAVRNALVGVTLFLGVPSSGCSVIVDSEIRDRDAGGGMDASNITDASDTTDAAHQISCEGASDGTVCGTSSICVREVCSQSRCGDAYVDTTREEQCDDGNAEAGDGCNPDCRHSCSADMDCEDGEACNGSETCDVTQHRCVTEANLEDGTECALRGVPIPDGADGGVADGGVGLDVDGGIPLGQCRAGTCVAPGCGNGVQSGDEECDDGNIEDNDGCDNDCTFTCSLDEDCQNETVCDGIETCDLSSHTCAPGEAPDCEDTENTTNARGTWGPDCTVDSCDPLMGCLNILRDNDTDGYPPASYTLDGTTYSCLGTAANDCNDIDSSVYPGAEEICDGRDNNCVMGADEVAPTWFADCDGDGFALTTAATFVGCTAPSPTMTGCPTTATARWTTTRPTAANRATYDCNDGNSSVRPNQTAYGLRIPASGFDWNCNGTSEQEAPGCAGRFCIAIPCAARDGSCWGTDLGWSDGVPACGNSGTYRYCERLPDRSCGQVSRSRTQRCR